MTDEKVEATLRDAVGPYRAALIWTGLRSLPTVLVAALVGYLWGGWVIAAGAGLILLGFFILAGIADYHTYRCVLRDIRAQVESLQRKWESAPGVRAE